MTSLTIDFDGRCWTLTDEASQSSYGEPVLVSDAGEQLRATEIAIPTTSDEIFGTRPAVYAYSVACSGERNGGEDITSEDWPAIIALLDRYAAQWQRDGGYSPNGVDLAVRSRR